MSEGERDRKTSFSLFVVVGMKCISALEHVLFLLLLLLVVCVCVFVCDDGAAAAAAPAAET